MTFWTGVWWLITSFFSLLWFWLSLFFVIPFHDIEVLWILIPIWINLIFTDFYQEKHGTHFGNAITNGSVMLWVGIDWIRFIVRTTETFSGTAILKIFLCVLAITLGILIMIEGVHGKKIVSLIGRVRETSYVMLVFSPLIYNLIQPSWYYGISIILFFPLFYFIFETIDRLIPDPKIYQEEKQMGAQ